MIFRRATRARGVFSFDTPNINCSKSFVENPIGTKTAQTMDVLGSTVQISPGVVNITVRPGSITNFTLSIRPARNYPLDLYILTDLSYSFNNDLSTLKTLGTNIANTLYNITTDYRIGFGSFVDKKVSPYVDVTPSSLTNSNAPYSFRHSVSLTSNITLFNSTLQAQVISYNQDEPEGGFDGFMQVLLCKKLIGWRDNARHCSSTILMQTLTKLVMERNVRQTSSDALVVQDHQNIAYLGQTVGNVRQTSSDAMVVQDHQNIAYLGQTVGNVRQTSSDAMVVQDHQNIAYLGQTVGVECGAVECGANFQAVSVN
eukprot:Em0002g209a